MPPEPADAPIDDDWIREYYPRIHRAAWLMSGDPATAEDLAQETFIIALDRWHQFEGRSSASTWLCGILLHVHQRHGRTLARMRRRLMHYIDARTSGGPASGDPQTELASKEWRQSIWALVAKLPRPQRDAVTLRFAENLTYEEIADTLGCSVGTAKTRVHHGIKRLRERTNLNEPSQLAPLNPSQRNQQSSQVVSGS
jgi:RNA polymerase sigma-70 factor, ECF subfamily